MSALIANNSINNKLPDATYKNWRACLNLGFESRKDVTVLNRRQHEGPLLVQRPFYPEGSPCHVYLIHPPGGVVAGDHLQLNAELSAGSHALITTPAATKFYRAAPSCKAVVDQHLKLTEAILEWLPQESIYFNGTSVRIRTRIDLDQRSKFIGWEMACYGRRACNEAFSEGHLHQAFELWRSGHPLVLDHLRINGSDEMQQAVWGLNGKTAMGSLLAYPATVDDVLAIRELVVEDHLLSCTIVDEVLICRCVCSDGAKLKELLQQVWVGLRQRILGRPAVVPRIWAT